jgi:hypothetical protein|tara:strand:- start:1878 stop:2237 length:360 start_codon:yes stop_codon:yes gene_type:complete
MAKKIGRPKVKIDDETCEKALKLSAQGLTMDQIAESLGMSRSSLFDKQARFVDFSDAIKEGRAKGIATITNALFVKAQGGDNTSMIFYLKNRAGWADKTEVDSTHRMVVNIAGDDAGAL